MIKSLIDRLKKSVFTILCLISMFTFNNVYAYDTDSENQKIDTYVTAREISVILAKMMGATDNMVNSEYMENVPNHMSETIINTFSKRELGYYNLLYQVYDEYSNIVAANKFFTWFFNYSTRPAVKGNFIYPALRTQGIIGYGDYIDIRAREYNYLPRELKGSEIFDYEYENIDKSSLKDFIIAFLKSKVSYYYDEAEFLKGNTKPIYKSKYCTYFDLLHKKYGFKNLDAVYDYIVSEIESGNTVKRITMIKELNNVIGYTDEKYKELESKNVIILPYHYDGSDVHSDEDIKAVAYARLYYLSEYEYDEAWWLRPTFDAGSEEAVFNAPLVEIYGSRSYTVRAQEFITGNELMECMKECLECKNIKYSSEDIDSIFKDISLDNLISKNDFDNVLLKFKSLYATG